MNKILILVSTMVFFPTFARAEVTKSGICFDSSYSSRNKTTEIHCDKSSLVKVRMDDGDAVLFVFSNNDTEGKALILKERNNHIFTYGFYNQDTKEIYLADGYCKIENNIVSCKSNLYENKTKENLVGKLKINFQLNQ